MNLIQRAILRLDRNGRFDWMSDKLYLRIVYFANMWKILNLKNPRTFNEKLQWLKLYDRRPEYTQMVDKFRVRDYIKEKLGGEYLIPLIGMWEHVEDIDFDNLPNKFVLKCNHNSGLGMYICTDKNKMDVLKVKKALKAGLEQDYYLRGREWPYKNVEHCIIAEEYMQDGSGELQDYKVMCFNGEPKLIQIHTGRFSNHLQDFYDAEWNKIDIQQGYPNSPIVMERPVILGKMLEFSRILSTDLPQARIDWYCVNGALYFGEITFFDGSGFCAFDNEEWDYRIGDWITLPEKK